MPNNNAIKNTHRRSKKNPHTNPSNEFLIQFSSVRVPSLRINWWTKKILIYAYFTGNQRACQNNKKNRHPTAPEWQIVRKIHHFNPYYLLDFVHFSETSVIAWYPNLRFFSHNLNTFGTDRSDEILYTIFFMVFFFGSEIVRLPYPAIAVGSTQPPRGNPLGRVKVPSNFIKTVHTFAVLSARNLIRQKFRGNSHHLGNPASVYQPPPRTVTVPIWQ